MTSAQLVNVIKAAFHDGIYPGDGRITDCGYKENLGEPCDECVEIADYFKGTSWREHNAIGLRRHESATALMTAEAFHYYLPAFLLAAVEDPIEADVILGNINNQFLPETSEYHQQRIQKLTRAQREAVIEYMKYNYCDAVTWSCRDAFEITEYLSNLLPRINKA